MLKSNYIFALDIGSTNIRSAVGEVLPNLPLQIICAHTSPIFGMRRGQVSDIGDVAEAIRNNVGEIEKKIGENLGPFVVSAGGSHIQSATSRGVVAISRADGEVSEEDIDRVIKAAEAISLPQNKEIIHILPKDFTVDKEEKIKDPIGIHGVRLEVECEVIYGSSYSLKNLNKALEESGIEVEELVDSTLASSESVLSKRQKELGVLLLDIGGSSTGFSVFEEGNLIKNTALPVGAAHITNDIAIAFQLPIEVAEKVKLKYGISQKEKSPKKEEIKLEEFGEEDRTISRKKLIDVIEARNIEILELANKELKRISRERLLPAGVVLVGGGAKMPGLEELVKKELHLPCQIGFPRQVEGVVDKIDDPSFAGPVGLLEWQLKEFSGGKKRGIGNRFGKNFSKIKKWFEGLLP